MDSTLSDPISPGSLPDSISSLIAQRRSQPTLLEPAPSRKVIAKMLTAASHAPDHMRLKPWRFLLVEGDALLALGDVFAESAAKKEGVKPTTIEVMRKHPLRAPMILVAIATILPEHKIPVVEQQVAVACAIQNALLVCEAEGFGSYWRTGGFTYDDGVKKALACAPNEEILGFLYLGTKGREPGKKPDQDYKEIIQVWQSPETVSPWSD